MQKRRTQRRDIRALVRLRAGGHCERCDRLLNPLAVDTDDDFASMHHRWPQRNGGRDTVSGLLRLCRACHCWLHRNEANALVYGWLSPEVTTSVWPVLVRDRWMWLADTGHYVPLSELEVRGLMEERGRIAEPVAV